MKIGWVMGWAVPEPWFAPMARTAFPRAEHVFFAANAATLAQLEAAGPLDCIVGYSLGAQLLLAAPARVSALGRVALLAPTFAFPSEEALGGRVSRTQVKKLARWLRLAPETALRDFYERAALDVPPSLAPVAALAELQWGLDHLATVRLEPPLPRGWVGWCGADDPLLDAAKLCALDPGVVVVPHATHHPRALLQAFAESERANASSRRAAVP